jgi:hypothetical protein
MITELKSRELTQQHRRRMKSLLPFLLLVGLILPDNASGRTVRYRTGILDGKSIDQMDDVTVSAARDYCMRTTHCVSFSYESPTTRFPAFPVTAYFFAFSDWHVKENGSPSFVEDPMWHSYINITREHEAVPEEILVVQEQLSRLSSGSGSKLRGQGGGLQVTERKTLLLESLFYIAAPEEHKVLAAPMISQPVIALASSVNEDPVVRQSALKLLVVLGDSSETGDILFDAGIFPAMKTIVQARGQGWDETSKSALDVISNICLHRSANEKLRKAGAHTFLQGLLSDTGFPGLQAALALTHIGDSSFEHTELPYAKIQALVQLVGSAIDGDITYGIKWDLIPGPLSAVKYLVLHGGLTTPQHLLDAGAMEQLFRILEADCLEAADVEAALEIMQSLAQMSARARDMLLLAEHTLHDTEVRLKQYGKAATLAGGLTSYVEAYDSNRSEL